MSPDSPSLEPQGLYRPARPARPSRRRVAVTGVGPISAIGCGRNEFWDALIAGRHGFGLVTQCDVSDSPSKIGAEVKLMPTLMIEKLAKTNGLGKNNSPRRKPSIKDFGDDAGIP